MKEKNLSWKYVEDFPVETPAMLTARAHSKEFGILPVSPATGSQLAVLAAASNARAILEIGTGCGVSGLWLLKGAPEATLTTIDSEPEHQNRARQSLTQAGIPPSRTRFISAQAKQMLPRMNDGAYDLVHIDADSESMLDYVEHGLRVVRDGGVVAIPHVLWHDLVPDPAKRGDPLVDFRTLLKTVSESGAVTASLSTAGDGLMQLVTKRA